MAAAPDPAVLRRIRWLAMLSAAAAVFAVGVPPLGVALGVATLVVAIRRRKEIGSIGLGALARSIPMAGGIFALVVGSVMSVVLLLWGDELLDYRDCERGALTELARDRCEREFMEAVS